MKLNFLILIAAASVLLGLAADSAVATITAKIPLALESRGLKMPPGTYSVVRSTPGTSVTVRNMATGRSFAVTANGRRTNRVDGVAAEISTATREKEMALTTTPETVIARAD